MIRFATRRPQHRYAKDPLGYLLTPKSLKLYVEESSFGPPQGKTKKAKKTQTTHVGPNLVIIQFAKPIEKQTALANAPSKPWRRAQRH